MEKSTLKEMYGYDYVGAEDIEAPLQCWYNDVLEKTEDAGVKVEAVTADKAYFRKDILDELEQKPAEAWSSMQRTIMTTICAALAGAVAYGIMQMIAAYAAH